MREQLESLGYQDYSWAMVGFSRVNPASNGKTITEIARERGVSPEDAVIDLVIEGARQPR